MLYYILTFMYALSGMCSIEAFDMEDDLFNTREMNDKQKDAFFSYSLSDRGEHVLKMEPLNGSPTALKIVMCDQDKIVIDPTNPEKKTCIMAAYRVKEGVETLATKAEVKLEASHNDSAPHCSAICWVYASSKQDPNTTEKLFGFYCKEEDFTENLLLPKAYIVTSPTNTFQNLRWTVVPLHTVFVTYNLYKGNTSHYLNMTICVRDTSIIFSGESENPDRNYTNTFTRYSFEPKQ